VRRTSLILVLVTLVAAVVTAWLFPRAFPILAIENRITREDAEQRADSFFAAHGLAMEESRRATLFMSDDSLRTFVELGAGGKDTLDALLRAGDVSLFSWNVRLFVPGEVTETRVRLSHDGRVLGFRRVLPDSLVRPAVDSVAGRELADQVLASWLGEPRPVWELIGTSYATRAPSRRLDRTYTYERPDRTIGGAPLRMDVVVAGDLVAEARPYVVIPESFARRYSEMRSANDLLALGASLGLLALGIAGMVSLRRYARGKLVRWRPPLLVAGVIGAFATASVLNVLPASWFTYDTAAPALVHQLMGVMTALAGGAATVMLVGLTLAAAEALTRHAFPWHADWWQLWRWRGTREVGQQVLGGYAMAAVGFAYIATFYLVTRSWLGWWVPSEMLDDPNQIATQMPWVAGIGLSLQAAIWEEALFRAIPLSLLAIWVGGRPDRERWMALGVVATALIFGFAHANYPSWPPYSRGVEIFLEACLWGVLFLRFGLLVPVLAHFAYDLVLFGLFATAGTATEYQVTAGVMLLALAAPALAVGWARVRQGRWISLPDEGRLGAWTPQPHEPVIHQAAVFVPRTVTRRSGQAALLVAVIALAGSVLRPDREIVGPAFTAPRAAVLAVADSVVRARGPDPAAWRRLAWTPPDTLSAWRRLLEREGAESLAVRLGDSYAIPRWWLVRYVRTDATVADRAEEWRVRVLPDGRALDLRHIVPEDRPGATLPADSVRRLARLALNAEGIDPAVLTETEFDEVERANRRDVTITFTDTATVLPAGASARAWVTLAGDEAVSARRGVVLPQAFLRETRRDEVAGMAVAGMFGVATLGLIIVGIVRLYKRPMIVHDAVPRRTVWGLIGLFVVAAVGGSLQNYAASLAQYDTAMPWDRYVSTMITVQILTVVAVALFAALWLLTNGMRRRAGIPIVAASAPAGAGTQELVYGAGLGALLPVISLGSRWLRDEGVPAGPTAILDQAVPLLAYIPDALLSAASIVPVAAIPALAVLGMSDHVRGRLIAAFVLCGLVGAAVVAADVSSGGPEPVALAWTVPAVAAIVFAVRSWGRVSVVTWIVAALVSGLLDAIGDIVNAPTSVGRMAATLALALYLALLAALRHWSVSQARSVLSDPTGHSPGGSNQDEVAEPA